ncbi:hypothetical protein OKW39_004377 [Paraburkholderia sp. MM6662-R1]
MNNNFMGAKTKILRNTSKDGKRLGWASSSFARA